MSRLINSDQLLQCIQVGWHRLSGQVQRLQARFESPSESTDYLIWRRQFLHKRLRLGLWIALFWSLMESTHSTYIVLFEFEKLRDYAIALAGDASLAVQFRSAILVAWIPIFVLLLFCLIGQRTAWGKRYPAVLFLIAACCLNQFSEQIVATFFGFPIAPDIRVFLAFAVLIPVHWRLHLLAQAFPIAYYAIVYPVIGLTTLGNSEFYNLYSMGKIIEIAWVCFVSNLAVYLYEQLKRSEFEAHRRLQVFLHSVSHDLQAPVLGTSIVLKSWLAQIPHLSQDKLVDSDLIQVKRSEIQRLLKGSDRQLALINSLLEAHTTETQGITLHCKPIQLKPLVDSVLIDLEQELIKKRIHLSNCIADDLPLVNADGNQLWRVFSNLIGNVIKHNPNDIELTLEARVIEARHTCKMKQRWRRKRKGPINPPIRPQIQSHRPMLLCLVQDNGVGIAPKHGQRLFELYARGFQARYMPGLGLGLYLCQQIIRAHGGEIGVESEVGKGATFWFTLPLYPTRA